MVGKQREVPPGLEAEIIRLYVDQKTPMSTLCQKYNLGYKRLRSLLVRNNVRVRGRGEYSKLGSEHPMAKLSREDLKNLKEDLVALRSHSELARKYNVSRERIRQLAIKYGYPSGRERNRLLGRKRKEEKDAAKAKAIEIRRQARELRYKPWRRMWAEEYTVKEMAHELGLKASSVGVRIVNLRKTHPGWFPKRRIWPPPKANETVVESPA